MWEEKEGEEKGRGEYENKFWVVNGAPGIFSQQTDPPVEVRWLETGDEIDKWDRVAILNY